MGKRKNNSKHFKTRWTRFSTRFYLLSFLYYWDIGFVLKNFLDETVIESLRKIVVNLALPSVLFVSFLDVELKPSYFFIFGITFLLCISLFLIGRFLKKLFKIRFSYFPYLTTGFEYGMLGISLFGAAYGLDKIGFIAVVDLGHEGFIWFVFLPMLLVKRDGAQNPGEVFKSFMSAPVVLAILSSIVFNILGIRDSLYQLPVSGALMTTLKFLGNLTVPLILIIVGHGIKINRAGIGSALLVTVIRLSLLIPLAIFLNIYLIRNVLHLDRIFEAALFTLLILPPPFIIPLYSRPTIDIEEKQYINNVLVIHTLVSVAVFLLYVVLHSTL